MLDETLLSGVNSLALAKSVGAVEVIWPPIEIGAPGLLALISGVLLLGAEGVGDEAFPGWAGACLLLGGGLLPLWAVAPNLSLRAIRSASMGIMGLGWRLLSAEESKSTARVPPRGPQGR